MFRALLIAALSFADAAPGQSRELLERLQRDDWAKSHAFVTSLPIADFADALSGYPDDLDLIDLRVRSFVLQRRDELLELWCAEPQARQRRAPVFARLPTLHGRYASADDAERRDLQAVLQFVSSRTPAGSTAPQLEAVDFEQRCEVFRRVVAAARATDAWRDLRVFDPDSRQIAKDSPVWGRPPQVHLAAALADADDRVAARARLLLRRGLRLDIPMPLRERLARDPAVFCCRIAAIPEVTEAIVSGWLVAIDGGLAPATLFTGFAPNLTSISPALRLRLAGRAFEAAMRELATEPNSPRIRPGTGADDTALRTVASLGPEGLSLVLGLAANTRDLATARRAMLAAAACTNRLTSSTTYARAEGLLLILIDHEDAHVAHQAARIARTLGSTATPWFRDALWQRASAALGRDLADLALPESPWRGTGPRSTPVPDVRVSLLLASAAMADSRLVPPLLKALSTALDGRPPHTVDNGHLRFLLDCLELLAAHVDEPQARVLSDLLRTSAEGTRRDHVSEKCRWILQLTRPLPPSQSPGTVPARLAIGPVTRLDAAPPSSAGSSAAAQRERARMLDQLRSATSSPRWASLVATQVLKDLDDADPQVRLAAYNALLTRDPNRWLPALLVFEARFDPDPAVRALGERLVQ
ncbi:MAG: hypothetical protein H6838_15500 [Planctomycetes bacterium]|nr:hypothetical protein [Planctomycetota bacterium]